jgi:nitroreductase
MHKSTEIEQPLLNVITERRSRRAYAEKPVEPEKIQALFEAARWAPSSNNEQPWAYIYATKHQQELYQKLFDSLMDGNKIWADRAPLLIASMVRKNFVLNNKPNGSARYDLGAANAFLSLQATQLGLNVHQMGGFDREKAHLNLNIPPSHEVVVMMAIGYPGDAEVLPEILKSRELAPRERYTQGAFVMNKGF